MAINGQSSDVNNFYNAEDYPFTVLEIGKKRKQ